MTSPKPPPTDDWSVAVRVWVECNGQAVLGDGRARLLEGICRHRSISAAARQLGMSYRRAWLIVQSVNQGAGTALVETATGGNRGGGAWLTPAGRRAVAGFRRLQKSLNAKASSLEVRPPSFIAASAIHIAAAVSLEEVLGQLLADYAVRRPDQPVRAIYAASNVLADQLRTGASFDLILSAEPELLEQLEAQGLILPRRRKILAANTLVAIGAADCPAGIRKPADLLSRHLGAIALAERSSPLGGYTYLYLERLGLHEQVRRQMIQVDNAHAVIAAIHSGQAAAGFVYGSDAAQAPGCRILFRVGRSGPAIYYTGAVCSNGSCPTQARAVLDFLASDDAARRFRSCGFLSAPAKPPARKRTS